MSKLLDLIRAQRRRLAGALPIYFERRKAPHQALGLTQEPDETFDAFTRRVDAAAEAQDIEVRWIEYVFFHPVVRRVVGGDGSEHEAHVGMIRETLDGEITAFDRGDNRIGAFPSLEAAFAAF